MSKYYLSFEFSVTLCNGISYGYHPGGRNRFDSISYRVRYKNLKMHITAF